MSSTVQIGSNNSSLFAEIDELFLWVGEQTCNVGWAHFNTDISRESGHDRNWTSWQLKETHCNVPPKLLL
jgi:hypothetical protein